MVGLTDRSLSPFLGPSSDRHRFVLISVGERSYKAVRILGAMKRPYAFCLFSSSLPHFAQSQETLENQTPY